MEEKLVTIASFDDYTQAELAKQKLDDFGIKSLIAGEDGANVLRGVPAVMELDLQVFESQVERAREILGSEGKEEQ